MLGCSTLMTFAIMSAARFYGNCFQHALIFDSQCGLPSSYSHASRGDVPFGGVWIALVYASVQDGMHTDTHVDIAVMVSA